VIEYASALSNNLTWAGKQRELDSGVDNRRTGGIRITVWCAEMERVQTTDIHVQLQKQDPPLRHFFKSGSRCQRMLSRLLPGVAQTALNEDTNKSEC
jgi:hypothetical protein